MKLYELLAISDDEITVFDRDSDIETYFYGIYNSADKNDDWETAMVELSKLLDVVKFSNSGVAVNLSEVIEKNIQGLKEADLFIRCNTDDIMDDIANILAGNVSEKWLKKFVSVLKDGKQEAKK